MTQRDIVCELEIMTENGNNRIVIRFVMPYVFPLAHSLFTVHVKGRTFKASSCINQGPLFGGEGLCGKLLSFLD